MTDAGTRAALLRNILGCSRLIPSLQTFFEHAKYLEPCARVLQGLLPPKQKRSLFDALEDSYVHLPRIPIEYGSDDIRWHERGREKDDCFIAYQQLCLSALRDFARLTDATPRKEAGEGKPQPSRPCLFAWGRLAELAFALGFRTEAIEELRTTDCARKVAEQVLSDIEADRSNSQTVDDLARVLRNTKRRKTSTTEPQFTADVSVPRGRRYGRPFQHDHESDRDYLYLPNMYALPDNEGEITSLFCMWDMFQSFWMPVTVRAPIPTL